MADKKCNYKLKGKYNGVHGYTNDDLTDKKAEKLVKEHPRGYDLFAVLPVDIQKKIDDRAAIEAKNIEAFRLKERDTMLDKQLKAEAEAKNIAKAEAIAGQQADAGTKRRARLVQLLSWDRDRLVKKAKDIGVIATGSGKELAKRIHKNEL